MYRKRRQNKRGGLPDFLNEALGKANEALGKAKEAASSVTATATGTIGSITDATTEGMASFKAKADEVGTAVGAKTDEVDEVGAAVETNAMTNSSVSPSEGGKSRRKRKTKRNKRTKRRSSVRKRR